MNSEEEHVVSDIFDVLHSVDTHIFALDSDHFKSSSSDNKYLRENIGESLSHALAYLIIYRPEDPIEFLAHFLIDGSHQKLIEQKRNSMLTQSFINEQQQQQETRHLFNERKEKKQEPEILFETDQQLVPLYQENFRINSHPNDEGELSSHFQEQKQQTHRTTIQQFTHTHETASGFDEIKSNQENNRSHICHDGNLSSFTYFSKLKDKIIKCDEF